MAPCRFLDGTLRSRRSALDSPNELKGTLFQIAVGWLPVIQQYRIGREGRQESVGRLFAKLENANGGLAAGGTKGREARNGV